MIKKELFGTYNGEEIYLHKVIRNNISVYFCELGACIASILIEDKNGIKRDVVLAPADVDGFANNSPGFGAVVGRFANRINHAKFVLNGKEYCLEDNMGDGCLHSGRSYHFRKWNAKSYEEEGESHVIFSLDSPDGDQGFPGNLKVSVDYAVKDDMSLTITYQYTSDADTYVNLTNHSYFNLLGHDGGNAMGHRLMIDADQVVQADERLMPTGKILDVTDSAFDFRTPTVIEDKLELPFKPYAQEDGYDINYVLNQYDGSFRKVAVVENDTTGIKMEVFTDLPGMQFYAANMLGDYQGKDGVMYHNNTGLCFETQYYPDSANMKEFPSPLVKAGETKTTVTKYAFDRMLEG